MLFIIIIIIIIFIIFIFIIIILPPLIFSRIPIFLPLFVLFPLFHPPPPISPFRDFVIIATSIVALAVAVFTLVLGEVRTRSGRGLKYARLEGKKMRGKNRERYEKKEEKSKEKGREERAENYEKKGQKDKKKENMERKIKRRADQGKKNN